MYLWTSENDFAGSHQIGPGDWTQIATFGDRCSYLLSCHHQPSDTENLHTECCFYKTETKLCWGCFYRKESIDGPGSRLQFKMRKVNFLILQRDTQLNFNFRIGKKKVSSLEKKKKRNNQEYPLLCSKIKEMTDFLLVPIGTAILPWVFQTETFLPRKWGVNKKRWPNPEESWCFASLQQVFNIGLFCSETSEYHAREVIWPLTQAAKSAYDS